jgi:hypothetical protein
LLSGAASGIIKLQGGFGRTATLKYCLELNLAVIASRSSLVGALIRAVFPENRPLVLDFLRGLSRDELECVAEFEGACLLESLTSTGSNPYRVLGPFFDPSASERWHNEDDCAHKTFILLAWLEYGSNQRSAKIHTASVKSA